MPTQKLASGLRVITKNLPGTAALTCLVLAGAGGRYETPARRGLSHFLEHMFFKGGQKYPTARAIAETIDAVGGEFNAFTGKEYSGYYIKVPQQKTALALAVLGDLLVNPTFPPAEIEKERGVILEEYNLYQDTPIYQVGWDFENLLFGEQPLGWDQIGTKENIQKFQQTDFQQYKKELYQPPNLIISLAGALPPADTLQTELAKNFPFPAGAPAFQFDPVQAYQPALPVKIRVKKTEQAHLVLGALGKPAESPDFWTQKLLAVILGGNMSSRMFLNIREKLGLCYQIRTQTDDYLDTGVLSTFAGVTLSKITEAITAIKNEYLQLIATGVTTAELQRAQEFLKGKLTLQLEDSEEYANFLGKQYLLYKEQFDLPAINQKIAAVTPQAIQNLAREILTPAKLRLSIIGPFAGRETEFAQLLKN